MKLSRSKWSRHFMPKKLYKNKIMRLLFRIFITNSSRCYTRPVWIEWYISARSPSMYNADFDAGLPTAEFVLVRTGASETLTSRTTHCGNKGCLRLIDLNELMREDRGRREGKEGRDWQNAPSERSFHYMQRIPRAGLQAFDGIVTTEWRGLSRERVVFAYARTGRGCTETECLLEGTTECFFYFL